MNTEAEVKDKHLTLKISGQKFELDVDEAVLLKCDDIKKQAKEKLEGLVTGMVETGMEDKAVCVFLVESINLLLGEKAVGAIFADSEPSIKELTELLCYLISQIGAVLCECE